jgi:O-acetyl-ADP-ribose deacetylase (regulator of RNase III)
VYLGAITKNYVLHFRGLGLVESSGTRYLVSWWSVIFFEITMSARYSRPPISTDPVLLAKLKNSLAGASVGDALALNSGIFVQGCNSFGVMGAGLAKIIAHKFPEVFTAYRAAYENDGLSLGQVVFVTPTASRPFWIANAITQNRIGRTPGVRYADLNAIAAAFEIVAVQARSLGLSVHYPIIGAGLGGLPWPEVYDRIEPILAGVVHQLWVHPLDELAALVMAKNNVTALLPLSAAPVDRSVSPPIAPGSPFQARWKRSPR